MAIARIFSLSALMLCVCCPASCALVQDLRVTTEVKIEHTGKASAKLSSKASDDNSNVVVWLTPVSGGSAKTVSTVPPARPRLVQKNKRFYPAVLVVPVGSNVEFPNLDPFFHNVFSLFDGRRFDLGLYEAGSTRSVRFDREGVSYIFCNIHPEMHAVVVALATPFWGISDRAGTVALDGVPPGTYSVHVWYGQANPESIHLANKVITLSEEKTTFGPISLATAVDETAPHKNKFGMDYDPPPASPY